MIYQKGTFQQLTPPGYFDFSAQQTAKTKAIVAWFDAFSSRIESQVNLYDETFRLWATRDYSSVTVSRTPWLQYLLDQNGIGWYTGTIAASIAILTYFSKSYPSSRIQSFQDFFTFIFGLGWTTEMGNVYFASNMPAVSAETLLVYSTAGSLPATPAPSPYVALSWTPPAGWSKAAASATYYSRGYLSGGNIVWMTPRSTSSISMTTDAANLAGLPGSPTTGDLCIVYADGTGDIGSVYYYDGAIWRKTTTPNANQGQVTANGAPIPGSAVWVPGSDPYITSATPVPATGPTQGYGYYGTYGTFITASRVIDVGLSLTNLGVTNLGMIVFLIRKLKPTLNSLVIKYTTPLNPNITELVIYDEAAL